MHRGFLIAVAAVGVLAVPGCGAGKSGKSGTNGAGAPVTATSTSSASATPSGSASPTATGTASSTAGSSATGTASAGDTSSTAGAAGSSQCAGLDAKMVPLPGAASGNTYADLVVVNHGKTDCMLPAQPELEYLGANHKPLPVGFSSDPDLRTPYKLVPGASAAMVIGYGSGGNPPCDGEIAYVRVTPPGDDLPFEGRMNCLHDRTNEEGWVAGTYAAPH